MLEFDLIGRLKEIIDVPVTLGACPLGIGDDAALLDIPSDKQLVICCDTLVAGVHFPEYSGADSIGYKSLAVNLSDLAAMGADPAWFLLALTLPGGDREWVEAFAGGIGRLAREAGIALVGGDTTSGQLSITVTAAGLVDPGMALKRSGAKPGDHVLVSGVTGLASQALQHMQAGHDPEPAGRRALEYPQPRLALGSSLRGLATACIDISDGLAADLGHILKRSGVGAVLDLEALPLAPSLVSLPENERWKLQLAGGDDYELCFTVPPTKVEEVLGMAKDLGIAISDIGNITADPGLDLQRPGGGRFEIDGFGFRHFSERSE